MDISRIIYGEVFSMLLVLRSNCPKVVWGKQNNTHHFDCAPKRRKGGRMKFMTLFFMQMGGKPIGKITNGIAVRDFKKGEDTQKAAFLGRFGEGQHCSRVGFLRKDPPAVTNGKVFEGRLEALENTRKLGPEDPDVFYVLAAQKDAADTRILVRVNTEGVGTSDPDANGTWWKEDNVLPYGWGKRTGTDGATSTWLDGFIAMAPREGLFIRPEGGYDLVLYYHEAKGLCLVSPEEYDRLPKPVVLEAPVPQPVVAPIAPAESVTAEVATPAKPKRSHHKKAVTADAESAVHALR